MWLRLLCWCLLYSGFTWPLSWRAYLGCFQRAQLHNGIHQKWCFAHFLLHKTHLIIYKSKKCLVFGTRGTRSLCHTKLSAFYYIICKILLSELLSQYEVGPSCIKTASVWYCLSCNWGTMNVFNMCCFCWAVIGYVAAPVGRISPKKRK